MASDLFGSEVLEVSAVQLDSQARFGEHTRSHRQVPKNLRPVDSLTAHDPARLVRSSYSVRVNDAKDFASHWENEIVPMLASSLPTLLVGPFSVDVHTYPQLASTNPPRLLVVTSSTRASSPAKEIITRMVVDSLPLQYRSVKLQFCQGTIELCANHLGTGPDDRDKPCQPRRAQYMSCPGPGASIGQTGDLNSASLGGFVNLGGRKSATTTRHQHDKSLGSSPRPLCVQHPSPLDQLLYQEPFSKRNPLTAIGHVSHWSDFGSLRPSLVFSGISQRKELISIEMDWAVIEIQGPGQNVIPTPSFAHASEGHVVTDFAEVSGTTEVYGVGRTSGYSLAYTSDVPGLQYFNGGYHREWTVRQHALNTVAAQQLSEGGLETVCPDLDQMKSTEEWITGGVGVPGDSGAWLMTRDGDRVIGHVWARSTSYGPINNQRLTYFTPFVDLKADIEDKSQKHLSLPVILSRAPARPPEPLTQMPSSWLFTQDSNDHWSPVSSPALRSQRLQSQRLIKETTPTAMMTATSVVSPSRRASMQQLVQQNSFAQHCPPLGPMFSNECTTSDSRRSEVPSWSVGSSTTGETDTTLWRTQDSESPDIVVPVFDDRTLVQEQMSSQLRRAKAVPTGDELRLVRAIMALSQAACMA